MSAVATPDLLPRPPGGMVPGAALALLAHAAMFVALTTVVQWRASPPEAVSAELWSALPQIAAPPAPEPTPAPVPPQPAPPPPPPAPLPKAEPPAPDPQIAIAQARAEREKAEKAAREQALREKAERDRAEKERQRKEREAEAERRAQAEAKKARAEEERLAQQRQKNLERLMGQVGAASGSGAVGSTGTAAQSSGPSASYTGRLIAAIKPNIVFTDTVSGNPAAEVEVRAGPSGSILSRRLVRSSGLREWDEAVLRAIDRTGTLPRDVDGRVPPVLTLVFRPQE